MRLWLAPDRPAAQRPSRWLAPVVGCSCWTEGRFRGTSRVAISSAFAPCAPRSALAFPRQTSGNTRELPERSSRPKAANWTSRRGQAGVSASSPALMRGSCRASSSTICSCGPPCGLAPPSARRPCATWARGHLAPVSFRGRNATVRFRWRRARSSLPAGTVAASRPTRLLTIGMSRRREESPCGGIFAMSHARPIASCFRWSGGSCRAMGGSSPCRAAGRTLALADWLRRTTKAGRKRISTSCGNVSSRIRGRRRPSGAGTPYQMVALGRGRSIWARVGAR